MITTDWADGKKAEKRSADVPLESETRHYPKIKPNHRNNTAKENLTKHPVRPLPPRLLTVLVTECFNTTHTPID